jgi:hypothetical protein
MLANNHFGKVFKKDQSKWWDGYTGEETVIMEDVDRHGGPQLAHYMKLWTDVYSLAGEIKGGKIPLNYKRFIVTSNFSIDRIYGPTSKMSEEEKEDAEVTVAAIKARFKEVYIGTRSDSTYWKDHVHELRPGKNRIPELVQEEVKENIPRVRLALIDRTHNVPTWKKDFNNKQVTLETTLGKRPAEHSPYASDSDMPSSINESDIAL